jgi:hypothetical protein
MSSACGLVDTEAQEEVLREVGSLEVSVYSACVVQRDKGLTWDVESAERIATAFEDLGLGTATVSHEEVPVPGVWHASQPKMMEESANAFVAYLQDHPVKTGYVFLPEFILGRSGHAARIHGYLVDSSGRVALVILTNSKWEGFDQAKLASPAACAEYLTGRIEIELKDG